MKRLTTDAKGTKSETTADGLESALDRAWQTLDSQVATGKTSKRDFALVQHAVEAAHTELHRANALLAEPARPRLPWWLPVPALALAAGLLIWLSLDESPPPAMPTVSTAMKGPARTIPATAQPSVSKPTEDVEPKAFTLAPSENVQLEHARIIASQASQFSYENRSNTLRLSRGTLRVSVDPKKREPFVVQSQGFSVHVLGTEFSVGPDSVSVYHGRVRITDPNGEVLRAQLSAGQTWSKPQARQPERSPRKAHVHEHSRLLNEARDTLAQGKAELARRQLQRVLSDDPDATTRAEAQSLLAECALVEGDAARASELYERVANAHRNSASGENALFAAASAQARAGNHSAARKLFRQYLERYPKGTFKNEARRRLQALE